MADRWFLVDAAGNKTELNSTFSADQLEAGGVSTNAVRLSEVTGGYERVGDGLRTPGPLVLNGIVFRDDGDLEAMWSELDEIETAVQTCAIVERRTTRTRTTYSNLDGGPPIQIAPDGLGGWRVQVELWPGRAEPTVLPTVSPDTRIHLYIDGSGSMDADIPALQQAVALLRQQLDTDIYGGTADQHVTSSVTPSGEAGERWLQFAAQLPHDDVIAIIAINEAAPAYHAVPRQLGEEPTPTFLADHAAWVNRVNTTLRRRAILYVVPHQTEATRLAFAQHVHDAFTGQNAYPVGLPGTGFELRTNVPTGAPADWYLWDMLGVIF